MNSDLSSAWESGKQNELHFWQGIVSAETSEYQAEWEERLDGSAPLQDYITKYLDPGQARVRVLDVGAGPLTAVGKVWPGHEVELVAVDALADEYDEILAAQDLNPPVRTKKCRTEDLCELFEEESFDLVHARNTLDHGLDPLQAIDQMLRAVKPGGALVTAHFANEGHDGGYEGMHQWNFSIEDGDLVLWNPDMREAVGKRLKGRARIAEISDDGSKWCHVVLIRENRAT
ncbi:MAG: class I SAM-dependent methyltransferase [Planctomycetota bacterium]|jgi:SAM-dependent methyltransferase